MVSQVVAHIYMYVFGIFQDNIKKLLSQNTTENTIGDGYQGDVSSGQSTPLKLASENIHLGEQLQSFLRLGYTLNQALVGSLLFIL